MLKTFLTILISLFCISTYANYSTPGTGKKWNLDSLVANSGGNVTFSSGSYMFNDTINVSLTDTVLVTTNATMRFAQGVFVDIFGVLKITPPDSAKITAQDTTTKFFGLKFEDGADGSILKKLIFEYGNAIRMLDCDILIDSCIIRNNRQNSSFASGAITFFRSNSTVSNCQIFGNRVAAIQSGANIASSGQIINNNIYDNVVANTNTPQINWGATNVSPPMTVRGNRITGGPYIMAGGIAFLAIGTANVLIENNIITHNRYGLAFLSGGISGYVNNNILDSNNIQNNPALGGSGINLSSPSQLNIIFTRNIIRGNLWGVTVQNRARPNFGDLSNSDTTDIGLNQLYWNRNTNQTYDFFNNTRDSIKAENNYWGTPFIDSVEAHIVHKPDIDTLGPIDYMPIRIVTSIGTTPSTSLVNGFKLNDAYPNPFNPATTVSFEVGQRMNVILSVYDMNGKLVQTLFSGVKDAGKYDIKFDAAKLSSGIYFYRLEADGLMETKKLILLK